MRQLLERLGDRLFASDDEWARQRGLRIVRTAHGLGRRYRDPRFDLIAECRGCAGAGHVGASRCGTCEGAGLVRLDQAAFAVGDQR